MALNQFQNWDVKINILIMIKRAFLTSLIWCISLTIYGLLLIVLGFREPGGYIPFVNPIAIVLISYWFFLAATFIHLILLKKLKWNKWLTASIGVTTVYILIIIPLILDDDYFESFDWRVSAFLVFLTVFLVLFDNLTSWLISKNYKINNVIIKRTILTSLVWCTTIILVGTLSIYFGIIKPDGYIPIPRLVNPFALFLLMYWFYLAAVYIHLILLKKLKWNKWLTASIGVITIYILIIIPLILADVYFESLDWRVPVFLVVQIIFLVFFDEMTKWWSSSKTKTNVYSFK